MKKTNFMYDKINKTFSFFDEQAYLWSKAVIWNINCKHSLDEQYIRPFSLICHDDLLSLTLSGLTNRDAKRILDLFALNGLNPMVKDSGNGWVGTFTEQARKMLFFSSFSSPKTSTIANTENHREPSERTALFQNERSLQEGNSLRCKLKSE